MNHINPSEVEGIRLSKRVMAQTQCSRTEAERLIEAGRVRIDGKVVKEIPRRVHPHQTVDVDLPGQAPAVRPQPATVLLHKPASASYQDLHHLLTDATRWHADRSGLVLPYRLPDGLTPLEDAASGLVVWSQDPTVVRRLLDESSQVEHEFMADVRGEVSAEQLQRLQPGRRAVPPEPSVNRNAPRMNPHPSHPHGPRTPRVHASIGHHREGVTRLRLAITGHQPGLVLDLCRDADLELLALARLRVGRVALKGLPPGHWRGLMGYEKF